MSWTELQRLRDGAPPKGAPKRKPDALEEAAAHALRAFAATDGGRDFIKWLRRETLDRETWHPLGMNAPRDVRIDFGHFREGQNALARVIALMASGAYLSKEKKT